MIVFTAFTKSNSIESITAIIESIDNRFIPNSSSSSLSLENSLGYISLDLFINKYEESILLRLSKFSR